jgi:F-type H+-transporting ATPase subunit b
MTPILLGIGALGFNLPALLAQLVNFGLLLLVFSVFLYRPLLKMLDQRKQRIQEGLDASDEAKRRLAETEKEAANQLAQARQEGQALINQAQQASARIQEEARQQAHAQSEQLLERARNEIQLERDSAIADLRREFADLTVTAAERVIRRSLDRQAHRQLIEEVLAEAPRGGGSDGGRETA